MPGKSTDISSILVPSSLVDADRHLNTALSKTARLCCGNVCNMLLKKCILAAALFLHLPHRFFDKETSPTPMGTESQADKYPWGEYLMHPTIQMSESRGRDCMKEGSFYKKTGWASRSCPPHPPLENNLWPKPGRGWVVITMSLGARKASTEVAQQLYV